MAPMKRSRWFRSRLTMPARTSPPFSRACMRAREAAVNAVSAAAKNADSTRERITIPAASQRLMWMSSGMALVNRSSGAEFVGQEGAHGLGLDAAGDEAPADAARQDEGERAGVHLLVLGHRLDERLGRTAAAGHVLQAGRQAHARQMVRDSIRVRAGAHAEPGREAEGEREPDRDRLAVDEPRAVVADDALQGVPEGVAEVEQRPVALLALVADDDRRLGAATVRHRMVARGAARENAAPVGLAPGEKRVVADEPVFHDFGVAGAGLARGQRVEERGVGDHEARLVKGADEVFSQT